MFLKLNKIRILVIFLLVSGTYQAFGAFVEPTSQEQQLYNRLLADFTKSSVTTKDVSKVLESFSSPVTISFPCDTNDLNRNVTATIKTRLAKFDDSLAHHEGATTGGIYVWKCNITSFAGKITINCDNELMLNSNVILSSTERDSRIKSVEDQVILYHEMLHGQLMLDAISTSDSWHHNACNKPPQDNLDYSYSDATHKVITPLQTEFATQLIKNAGGEMKVQEISPEETSSGTFTKKIGSLYDYPNYVKSGVNVSARSYNVANMQIISQKIDIMLSGTLLNKTQSGIVWLYIFGNTDAKSQSKIQTINEIPNTTKEIPKETKSATIPSWIKNNAKWWADGTIADSDFVSGIQYLVRNGILQIGYVNTESTNVKTNSELTNNQPAQVSNGAIQLNNYIFEKSPYHQIHVEISGKIANFKSGTSVILTITKPDQSSYDLKGIITKSGQFIVPLMLDGNSPNGQYTVTGTYNGVEIGSTSFSIE